MNPPRAFDFVNALLAFTLVGALSGCVTTQAGSSVPRGADLSAYSTYSWLPPDRTRIDPASPAHEDIRRAVEIQLDNAGLRKVAPGRGQLVAHYRFAREDRFIDRDFGDASGGLATTFGSEIPPFSAPRFGLGSESMFREAGVLLFDLVDAQTRRLVWRGSARTALDDTSFGAFHNRAAIHRAVQEIFLDFPR